MSILARVRLIASSPLRDRAQCLLAFIVLLAAPLAGAHAQTLNANPGPSNNGGAIGWGLFFDLTASAGSAVSVTHLTTASTAPANAGFTVEIFTRSGTGLGGGAGSGPGSSSSGWTSLGSVPATQGAVANGVSLTIDIPDIAVPAGQTVGVAMVFTGAAPRYFGTGTPPIGTYSDANLTLTTGNSRSTPFTTTGTFFASRELIGTLTYTTSGTGGFTCSQLAPIVGSWGLTVDGCGNFSSNATTARYESAIFEGMPPQTRGAVAGEYSYEVEFVANRPRQPSASSSILVAGSPYPLRTATQNWDRAIAFNISHNGKYSIFRYNGPGLPVALQKWVVPVGVAINLAPASNTLRVERVVAGAGHNLRFAINGVTVNELPDTLGVDQFGTGFVRSVPTTGNLVTDDWMDVLDIQLDLPGALRPVSGQISRAQQQANAAANGARGGDNPLFAPGNEKQ